MNSTVHIQTHSQLLFEHIQRLEAKHLGVDQLLMPHGN